MKQTPQICWELMILIITINVYLTQYLIFLLLKKVKNHAFYHSMQEHSVNVCYKIFCSEMIFQVCKVYSFTVYTIFTQNKFKRARSLNIYIKKKKYCALCIDHI